METFQNTTAIILNGTITANKIINFSTIGNLRVDMPFRTKYGADIEKAKYIVNDVLANDIKLLKDPAPRVEVNNLGEKMV